MGRTVGGVHAELGRRQREDQPAAARVDGVELERVAQERARGLGVGGERHEVGSADGRRHGRC
jgi:hypothetical protein